MEHTVRKGEDILMAMEGGKSYTVADIEALPEGERAELIDGELFMMASPTWTHQDMVGWLDMKIRLYILSNKGKCRIGLSPFAVYIKKDNRNYVEPDISVVCDRDKMDDKGCHGAPDWVIEVVSPSSRYMDYVRKLALYQSAGVKEYWIVDPLEGKVTVYDFAHKAGPYIYSLEEQVKTEIFEDFCIDFAQIQDI